MATITKLAGTCPITFYMTVRSADGTTAEGAASDADVVTSLARAARRGYQVELTSRGGADITRTVPGKGRHTVAFKPVRPAGTLTATVRRYLGLIDSRPAEYDPEKERINAGWISWVPPVATARLRSHGLVSVDGATVTVSLSARLAMSRQDRRPGPWGYVLSGGELAELVRDLGQAHAGLQAAPSAS